MDLIYNASYQRNRALIALAEIGPLLIPHKIRRSFQSQLLNKFLSF